MDRQDGARDLALENGSLVLHSPPLRVGFADELLEEVLRRKNSWDVLRKRHEWLVVIGVDQAFPEAAKHHDPQHASTVDEMAAQILFDFEFCLALAADRRSALHEVATGHSPDGVAERELAVGPHFSFNLVVSVG